MQAHKTFYGSFVSSICCQSFPIFIIHFLHCVL
jgi:hypothetical protein